MKLKTLIVSVAVLAVLSAVVFIVRRPGLPPSADVRLGKPLVDRSVAENATKLQVSDQGKTITLAKQADGSWRNESYHELPADLSKLSGFVSNLVDSKLERLVTTNVERIGRLEFKDTRIELFDSANKPLLMLTVGKSFDTGGRFVRFGEENKAYLADLNVYLDVEPKSWASTELLSLKSDDIAKVEIGFGALPANTIEPKTPESPATTVSISRAKKDDTWTAEKTPDGQRVKADRISSLISSVGTLRFTETTDPADPSAAAAKANPRVIKLTTFDGKTYTVALGRKPEEKKLKPPTPSTDGKTGPASLGSLSDLAKKGDAAVEKKTGENTPAAPEFETVPAGPVFAFVSASDPTAGVNKLMQKRAFQIPEYVFTSLPQKPEELFEPAPAEKKG